MEQLKHTTVILPNAEIESLKEQVRQLTSERDEFEKEAIEAKIKVEKIRLLMEDYQELTSKELYEEFTSTQTVTK